VNENHVAFNGGEGGVAARPTHEEEIAKHEHHTEPLAAQTRHEHMAGQNKQNFASANHGRPAIAATAKPGVFSVKGVVAAKSAGAPYKAPAMSPKQARGSIYRKNKTRFIGLRRRWLERSASFPTARMYSSISRAWWDL
jgi:hypothetical protein